MKAFRLDQWNQPGTYVEVPKPVPGHGECLIKMKAAGLCRSDLDMLDSKPGSDPWASAISPGYILGHENAGIIEQLGEGVSDIKVGEGVVVHHLKHCGVCNFCTGGAEQHCEAYKRGDVVLTRGAGLDGGLAEYLVAPRNELVFIGDQDPVLYAPLTDAGVTAYHAVKSFIHRVRPNSTTAVIGIGGLGAYGVQFIKLLSAAKVLAIDKSESCLALAKDLGADEAILSDASTGNKLLGLTNGAGIDYIVDFVGSDQTLALAAKISRPQGRIVVVGMEGGSVQLGWNHMATSCEFALSMGSTRQDLEDVCSLASAGKLRINMQKFTFDQIQEAYDLLRAGKLTGRAVIVF
ncbi:hypothetical protein KCU77_g3524, partial [Aureobasidium melanogenum]